MELRFNSLVEMQLHSCKTFGDQNMFGTKGSDGTYSWITYGQFDRRVASFRGGLASLGVTGGDKVAIISNNCVEFPIAAYGTYSLGAHFVPMYESQIYRDWKYILKDSGAKILLVRSPSIYKQVLPLKDEIPTLTHILHLSTDSDAPMNLNTLTDLGDKNPTPPVLPDSEEPFGLIYTSGTTGNPKGVILTHGNIMAELTSISTLFPSTPGKERGISFLPWGHLMGQIVEIHLAMLHGASAALVTDIREIAADLPIVKPTVFFGVPKIYNKIYEGVLRQISTRSPFIQHLFHRGMKAACREDHRSVADTLYLSLATLLIFRKTKKLFGGELRFALSGAAALKGEVGDFLRALGIPLYEGFGLTESTMAVTTNCPANGSRSGSVGKAVPGARIELDTSVGTEGSGEGEVIVYGPHVMQGYHNLPAETARAFTPDRGLRTGDLGRMDEDGFLYITGRIKEIYKLENGKYIAPTPLEELLQFSPFVDQAMVTGANKKYNIALIVPDMEELRRYAAEKGIDLTREGWQETPPIVELFEKEIEGQSQDFRGFERCKKFIIVSEEWSPENGMLTPTLKLKRNIIADRYKDRIEELYESEGTLVR